MVGLASKLTAFQRTPQHPRHPRQIAKTVIDELIVDWVDPKRRGKRNRNIPCHACDFVWMSGGHEGDLGARGGSGVIAGKGEGREIGTP